MNLEIKKTTYLALSFDKKKLICCNTDENVMYYQIDYKNCRLINISFVSNYGDTVRSVAFHPKSDYFLSGTYNGVIRLWDINTDSVLNTFGRGIFGILTMITNNNIDCIKTNYINGLEFHYDGLRFISCSSSGSVIMWHVEGFSLWQCNFEDSVTCVTFSHDYCYLLIGLGNGEAHLLNIDGNEERVVDGHIKFVSAIAFTSDDSMFLTASHHAIILWSIDGRKIRTFLKHTSSINSISLSPNGETFVSTSNDNKIIHWDLNTGTVLNEKRYQQTITSVVFVNDELIAIGTSACSVKLINLNDFFE